MLEREDNIRILGQFNILEADDGVTGIEVMQAELAAGREITYVLMDYVMLKMNGPEAARKMRCELGYEGPIIGVTGNALPEDIAFFIENGANSVVIKPLTNAKMLESMQINPLK